MKPKQKANANFSKMFRSLVVGVIFIAVTVVGVNASGSALAAAVSEFLGWSTPAFSGDSKSVGARNSIGRIIRDELPMPTGPAPEFTTQVYADDFSTNNGATYTTSGAIAASGWNVLRSGADWGARRHTTTTRLELTNDVGGTANVNGWVLASTPSSSFSSPYNTTLSSNPGPVTWTFNMRQSQANPAGFAAGNYGVAFIVAGTSTTNNNTGSGYAVVLGQSGTTDPVRLARYSGGVQGTMTNIITSNTAGLTDFGAEYLSIKVVYTPSTNTWELFLRNDGAAFADPATGILTSQGTAVDSTSTGTALALMGGWWQGSTAAGQPAYYDNTVVSVETPSPGTVEFSSASYSDLEGSTKSITVNRVGGSLGAASVDYATGGGSAAGGAACGAGVDYVISSGTLNWADGDAAPKSFNVVLCTDGVTDNENLQLTLSNATGATISGTNPATLDITDNPPGTLQLSATSSSADENLLNWSVLASRTGGSGGAVSVDYAVTGGTATNGAACTAGVDYVLPASGTLNWANLDTANKTITLQLCADLVSYEGPETVIIEISNVQGGASLGSPTLHTVTINDMPANFSNPASIGIPNVGPSALYPSDITVAGVPGALSNLTVTLSSVTHTYPDDIFVLLVGPGGQTFVLQGLAGGGGNITNRTYVFSDSAANLLADETSNPSGSYKPTNYFPSAGWPPPAPGGPYAQPGPSGTDTLNGIFGGIDPNGTWSLYVNDFADPDAGAINGGWSLQIQTTVPSPGTVEFSAAAYNGPEGGTATINAKRVGGSLGAVSVDYATSNGSAAGGAGCGAGVDFVNASGTLNWADGDSANKSFTVTLCSDPLTSEPTETVNLTLSNPVGTSITGTNPAVLNIENNSFAGSIFTNPAPITIPVIGTATPYPSTIDVSGMPGAITEVRVVLKNFSHTYTSDTDILLVGPGGQKFVLMSDVGSNTAASDVTLSFYDSAAANLTAAALTSGSFKPTDMPGAPDSWPAPAPSAPYNSPAPWGGATFGSVFAGADPNGTWSLYAVDSISPDGGSIAGGWELQIAAAETVRFDPGSYTPAENAGTVSLTVVRPSSATAATVDYTLPSVGSLYPAIGGASCGAGIDYINTPGTVNFGIGDLTKNIDITLCDDAVFDGLKIILPELSNPTGGLVLGSPSVGSVFINDDEPEPTLSISDVTVNESDGTATFQVTQSFATTTLTQFNYSTSDGSALAGFDYTGSTNAAGQITAGNTSTTIVVPILGDTGFEETETFTVSFTNIVNAGPGDPVGVGTITDDDTAASYVVTTTNNTNDGTCNATHCSLREAITASNAAPGTITFAPGVTGTITFSASRPQITNNTVINGPGADVLAVSGNNAVTVFDLPNAGTAVTIRGLTIRNGFNLDFAQGGGIQNNALLLVENSVITASRGNFAGAIQTFAPMTIRNSTLSNNVGGNDGMQPGCSSIGGAIDSSNDVTINIINSTISGNSVSTNCSANAGAINLFAGRVVITGSTITNNTGSNFSGAIDGGSAQTSIVRNSIIAGNTGDPANPDVNDTIIESGGFNIIGNPGTMTAFNQPTDQTGTTGSPLNPMLAPLANNGGTTPTHALLTGSPALDKGSSFGLTTDQRGSGRPYDDPGTANAAGGDGSDIGAYEAIVPVISVTGGPLSFGSVLAGEFSVEQSYTVSGMNLTGDLTVTAPAEFQVSTTSGSGFGNSVTLTQSGGTVTTTTIYARFAPTSAGPKSGNITNESPSAATQTVEVSGTGASAGSIQFAAATPASSETNADHVYNVVVTRTGGSYGAVSVDFTATDGTATTAGNDYSIASATGTLNWTDGDSADKNIEITIKGDVTFEPDETINLAISNPTGGAALASPAVAVLTITNDDSQPAISVDDVTFTGADSLVGSGFTVSLSNPSTQTVTVHYETANDTAVSGEDYTATSGTLTFNPGETSQNVPVTILPDTVNEATEQFFMNLDTPVNATIEDGQGVGTIPNDDPDVSFSIDDLTLTEGNSGTVSYTFTITKTGTTAQTTSVDWSTVNGSAVSPLDFASLTGNLSFAPADTSKTITVQVNGDTSFETDETFIVRLSNPVSAILTDGDGLGTITNDDAPQIFLVNVNSDTDDGTCDAANCSLREAINAVNIAGGQINFAPNVTGAISLLSALPPLASSNATVINGPGAGVLAVKRDSSIGALRIFDVQGSGVFTISGLAINDGDVRPIGGAFNNLGGAIRIMNGHGVAINNCTFTNNWANNGAAIYNGANPATSPLTVNNSTFTANNANQSGGGIENRFSNRLTVNGSTFNANGANTFGGGIHNIASGVVFINDSTFTGNVANTGGAVNNDDTGSLTITRSIISGNQAVVGGGISNKNGGLDVFNSTISGNNASEGGGAYNHVATMNFYNSTISGNTATSIGGGIYYTFQGQSNGTIQNCTITGNQGPNGGGVMVFNGSSVVRAGNTILAANTGSQGPDLYGTIYSSGYNILGTLGGTWGHMDPAPGDQIGQFSVINPVLAPLADNGGPTRTHVPLPGSPAINAGNAFGETADQRGFARTVGGATDIGAVEVQPAPTQIAVFAGSPQSVTEGTSFSPLQARVLDAGNAPVGGVTVTFTAPSSGPSGLFANSTTQTTAITDANGIATSSALTANNTEGTFSVTASYATSPTASFDLSILAIRDITVDDIAFTGTDSLVPAAGFTVSLSAASIAPITVQYHTTDGTAIAGEDYTAASGTLTFDPGETSKLVPIAILPDAVNEPTEDFYLDLDTPTGSAVITDARGVGTIPNDDPEVSFLINDVTQAEGNSGTTGFTFTVTKNGATSLTSSVNYATQNGTAAAGSDFTAVSGTLTFAPAETSKEVTVLVNGDTTFETSENFSVVLTSPTNATLADDVGSGTLTNDDAPPSFSVDSVSHSEGDSGTTSYTFTVTQTGATDVFSTVDYQAQSNTADIFDFAAASGTLNFDPGETVKQFTVFVNGDQMYEDDELFNVVLSNPQNAAIGTSTGTGTILNDDVAPTISIDDVTMTEGDSGTKTFTFTITKTGLTAFNGGVDYVVQDGTATATDGDFAAAPGNVGFLIADTSKTVSVTVNGDAKYESEETFVVHLQNEAGLVVTKRDGTGTITNDDAQPTVSISDYTFTGADSVVTSGFTVTLTGETALPATIHYQTADGTAIAGEDYTAASGTLRFNPGETQVQNIPVSILPDTTQEATEQFVVNLDAPVGATIGDGQGVGTIPNDDAAPTFSIDNVTQAEGVGGFTTFVFFVTKTGPTALPSSIDYTTEPGTATAGAVCGSGVDYETRSGTLNFAAGDTSQMVLVNVCGDTTVELDETFNVLLSNPVNGGITGDGGLGTIQNNTTPAVQFQSAAYVEDESQTAVITLIRTGDSSGSSEVTVSTSNGTATGGSCSTLGVDYESLSTAVTFDPTETTRTVSIPVCMDTLFETTFETVNLALSSHTTVLGDQSTATLNLNDTAAQHKSTTPITIGDGIHADPYPATINVTGAPSVTGTMRITLFDLTHARPEDLDILLVAPNGQTMVLMADAGGSNALTGHGATITFDDMAGAVLPDSAPIATGKYEPTTWGPVVPFASPAPAGPYAMPNGSVGGSINLGSVFGPGPPNGTWQLFIRDQSGLPPFGAGQIAAGWGLQFLAPTSAETSISGRVTTAGGNGIRNAVVKITGGNLIEPRYAVTGSLGSYVFEGLPTGQTYIVQVSAKRFRFAQPSMVVTLQDATSLDFVANP